ncbi:uncharacterized protein LOC132304424 isoform X2 [Cornus florida]|uniref:uncharacterized protein LOC132304424 isoform X1 n=1 Tax=Cornus florida TaxID=4283 RepID=UPI0028A206EB|nr:uncharacterized protein LOC132304424 isoform X1 [Cornus florida]XP_059658076.1 uncharacterized protein LOC132304424 isoform X2 [Cornus florida]
MSDSGRVIEFENRSSVEMEIRIFTPPDRPDRYKKIIRIEPCKTQKVLSQSLFPDPINHTFLLFFTDGVYARRFELSQDVVGCTNITCEINHDGELNIQRFKDKLPAALRILKEKLQWGRNKINNNLRKFSTTVFAAV